MKLKLDKPNDDFRSNEDIDEDRIRDVTQKLVFNGNWELAENELLFEIIKLLKCDLNTSKDIFQRMKELGLEVCYSWNIGYSIRKFAYLRDYVTDEEFQKLDKKELERLKKEDAREAKFIEKYGIDKSKWSDDVWDEYEYGEEETWV